MLDNPLIIVWRITEKCNLGCPFCAFDKNIKKSPAFTDPTQIRRFMPILADYSHQAGRTILISWLGGEPFLWPELILLTEEAHQFGFSISTTTNGTLLGSQRLRNHILDYFSELTVSVDGLGDTHGNLRRWPRGFEKLRTSICKLRDEKRSLGKSLLLRANIVLMQDNIDQFVALCHEIADWGISVITFNQLGGRDRPEFFPDHRLTKTNVEWLVNTLPEMKNSLASKGVTLLGSEFYLARFVATANGEKISIENCGPGEQFLFIDEKGVIAPCSFTGSAYGVDINSLEKQEDLAAIANLFRERQISNRCAECDDCYSTQIFEKFESTNQNSAYSTSV